MPFKELEKAPLKDLISILDDRSTNLRMLGEASS